MTVRDTRPTRYQIIINIDMESFWREAVKVALLVAGCSLLAVFLHVAFTDSKPSPMPAFPSATQEEGHFQAPQTRSD